MACRTVKRFKVCLSNGWKRLQHFLLIMRFFHICGSSAAACSVENYPAFIKWQSYLGQALAHRAGYVYRLQYGLPEILKQPPSSIFEGIAVELYLLRHGETRMNRERRYLGVTDVPLDEVGKAALMNLYQAGHFPAVDFYISSPLLRCLQSAQIMFPNQKPYSIDERLQERDFGSFEGQTYEELMKFPEYVKWLEGKGEDRPPGEEAQFEIQERISAALKDILRTACSLELPEKSGPLKIGLVIHGGVIMEIMKYLRFDDYYAAT